VRLRPDLVLVRLPPSKPRQRVKLIKGDLHTFLAQKGIEEFNRLLQPPTYDQPIGRVVQVGTRTHDVWPGDCVLIDPEAGQPIEMRDEGGRPWPHLLIAERDIAAILESV
jgi:hypothetical protein